MYQVSGIDAFEMAAQWNARTPKINGKPLPLNSSISSSNLPAHIRRPTALEAYGPSHTQAFTFLNNDGSITLDNAYREVLRRARFLTNFQCSFERFIKLVTKAGEINSDTVRAIISGLQLEADGKVSNVRKDPVAQMNRVKAFDFLTDGPNGETHL